MACEPMSKKTTIKNVAGFHSLDAGDFAVDAASDGLLRRNLGMTECHNEGWATRGRESVDAELAYRVLMEMLRRSCKASPNKHKLLYLGSGEWDIRAGRLDGTVERRRVMLKWGIVIEDLYHQHLDW